MLIIKKMVINILRESHPVKVGLRLLKNAFTAFFNSLRESHPVKVGLRL